MKKSVKKVVMRMSDDHWFTVLEKEVKLADVDQITLQLEP